MAMKRLGDLAICHMENRVMKGKKNQQDRPQDMTITTLNKKKNSRHHHHGCQPTHSLEHLSVSFWMLGDTDQA
jgi:hypothetical protein